MKKGKWLAVWICMILIVTGIGNSVNASGRNPATGSNSAWADPYIVKLQEAGVIERTLPKYKSNITRLSFAQIAVTMYEEMTGEEVPYSFDDDFTDTGELDLFESMVIAKAKIIGISNGYGDGSYKPNKEISREEMATMFVRALKASGQELPSATGEIFSDHSDIATWASENVYIMKHEGIINGVGNNMFAPGSTATVEQAVVMMVRVLDRYVPGWEVEDSIAAEGYFVKLSNGYYLSSESQLFGYRDTSSNAPTHIYSNKDDGIVAFTLYDPSLEKVDFTLLDADGNDRPYLQGNMLQAKLFESTAWPAFSFDDVLATGLTIRLEDGSVLNESIQFYWERSADITRVTSGSSIKDYILLVPYKSHTEYPTCRLVSNGVLKRKMIGLSDDGTVGIHVVNEGTLLESTDYGIDEDAYGILASAIRSGLISQDHMVVLPLEDEAMTDVVGVRLSVKTIIKFGVPYTEDFDIETSDIYILETEGKIKYTPFE